MCQKIKNASYFFFLQVRKCEGAQPERRIRSLVMRSLRLLNTCLVYVTFNEVALKDASYEDIRQVLSQTYCPLSSSNLQLLEAYNEELQRALPVEAVGMEFGGGEGSMPKNNRPSWRFK